MSADGNRSNQRRGEGGGEGGGGLLACRRSVSSHSRAVFSMMGTTISS